MTTIEHFCEAEMAARLPELQASPADGGVLMHIIVRPDKDLRELPDQILITSESGVSGDRWARYCTRQLPDGQLNPDTQITLTNTRMLAIVAGDVRRWPLAGDNLLVDLDLSQTNLPVGQRLKIGEAIIEITAQPHTGCSKFSARFGADALKFVNSPEGKQMRLRGVHAQVVQPGVIKIGDRIEKV